MKVGYENQIFTVNIQEDNTGALLHQRQKPTTQ